MNDNENNFPLKAGDYVKFCPVALTEKEIKDLKRQGIKTGQILRIRGVIDDGKLYFSEISDSIPWSEFKIQKFRYAEFWDRLFADLLDGLLSLAIAYPFYLLIDKLFFGAEHFVLRNINDFGLKDIVLWIIFLYNMTYLVGKNGQSWGRRFFKIKVIDYFGRPIGFWKSLFRNFFAITISTIGYLGFLWIFWDDNNQAWHDKIFKTYVVLPERGGV